MFRNQTCCPNNGFTKILFFVILRASAKKLGDRFDKTKKLHIFAPLFALEKHVTMIR